MNEYVGKTCPYCKCEFKEGDDIVVCSACDMPHHKECWAENQGCTTFGCMGTIMSIDDTATTVTTKEIIYEDVAVQPERGVFCTRCGERNSASASYCCKCGNQLVRAEVYTSPVYSQATTHSNQGYSYYNQTESIDSDIAMFVGPKTEYYMSKFRELKTQNKQTTWNWPAFLVAPYWFIYRKMYGYGAGILAIALVLSAINAPLISLLALGGYIVIGIFANYIYMKHLENLSRQVKSMSEPYRSQFIAKNGGVNTTATILTIIGYLLLSILLV